MGVGWGGVCGRCVGMVEMAFNGHVRHVKVEAESECNVRTINGINQDSSVGVHILVPWIEWLHQHLPC